MPDPKANIRSFASALKYSLKIPAGFVSPIMLALEGVKVNHMGVSLGAC